MPNEFSYLMLYGGYSLFPASIFYESELPDPPLTAVPIEGSVEEVDSGVFVHCLGNDLGMAGDVTIVVLDSGQELPAPDAGRVDREHSFTMKTGADLTVTTTDLDFVSQITPPTHRCQVTLRMVRATDASRGQETHYFTFEPAESASVLA